MAQRRTPPVFHKHPINAASCNFTLYTTHPRPRRVLSASCLLFPPNTHYLPPQTVSTASELRKPIYWIVAAKAIDYEQMLLLMAGVKWDIREIMSQHNVYVDVLLKVILLGGGVTQQLWGRIHV